MKDRTKRQLIYLLEAGGILLFWVALYFWLMVICASGAQAQMQTGEFGWNPNGVYILGGVDQPYDAVWYNTTGQNIYIWGAQLDIWFGGMVTPTASVEDYVKNVADLGVTLRLNNATLILEKGGDHYGNDPSFNRGPVMFPRPFTMGPGSYLFMHAHGHNGFQPYYGGQLVYNANGIVYYTVGTP